MLLERYVITEKTLEASRVFSVMKENGKDSIRFISMLDSNKLTILTYPDDKHVEIHFRIVLKNSEFDPRVVDTCNADLKRRFDEMPTKLKTKTSGATLTCVETMDKHCIFGYKIVATGTAVLDEMIKGRLENSVRLEAMRIEKQIVQFGR